MDKKSTLPGWIFHGEKPHTATVIGGLIMLFGVLFANFGRKSTSG